MDMENDSSLLCRVCLKTSLEYIDLESLYDNDNMQSEEDVHPISSAECLQNSGTLTYLDCFRECTRLDLEINGFVLRSICVACGLDLRIAYEFLKKAERAAQFFQQSIKDNRDLYEVEIMKDENLSCSTLAMEENASIKLEDFEIEEVNELNDALSINEKEPSSLGDEFIDILEPKDLTSNDESQYCNEKSFEVTFLNDEENNANVEHYSKEDEHSVTKDVLFSAKKSKQMCNSIKLYGMSCKKNVSLAEPLNSCTICHKNLDGLNLPDHIEKFHMQTEECQQCDYKDSEFKVRKHEKIKHSNFLCYICSKTFLTLGILNAHLKYHERKQSNFKSDACKICGKKFSSQNYLHRHLEVHKNERSLYKCDLCDKSYFTKYALANHIKMHKGDTIKCMECDKEFSRQYELNVHMRFHSRDYPFSCEVCGKKFAIRGHLTSHMWKHQGLKLQCEDCGKLFTSSKALLEHSYSHTEMPFPCCYCPKAYPSRQKFKVHLKTVHSIQLNEEELRKVTGSIIKRPFPRKKLTLVQADSVMKEVEVNTKSEEIQDVQDLVVELFE